MPGSPFQFPFNDSSDDEQNSYLAEVVPVIEDTEISPRPEPSVGRHEQEPSWFQRALNATVSLIFSSVAGGQNFMSNEPFNIAQNSPGSIGDDEQWNYRSCQSVDESVGGPSPYGEESLRSSDHVAVDLREAILEYKRAPSRLYMGIILASISPDDVKISGDILQAAAGNRELTKTLLTSGRADLNDRGVQRIIQEEIDSLMVGDEALGDRINPANIDYLKILCCAPSATVTKEQALSCRYAGLEFAKILYDNPHLLRNLPPPSWLLGLFLDICFVLDMVLTWVGLLAIFLHVICVGWVIYDWREKKHYECSSWTIFCHVIGYVVSIVAVMTSEEGRMRHYEDCIWPYPDNTLKVIPCIPVFEVALMYVTLRYQLLKDKSRYFVIRYDLYNGLMNVLLLNTYLFSIPQFLLQYYLRKTFNQSDVPFLGYTILMITDYTSYGISTYLFLRNAICSLSCNRFGFAVVAAKQSPVKRRSITSRILTASTASYLECVLCAVLLTLPKIAVCETVSLVFILIAGTAVVTGFVLLLVALVFDKRRVIWGACWPAALVHVTFTIVYTNAKIPMDVPLECSFYSLSSSSVPVLMYLTFSFLWVAIFAAICVSIYDRVTNSRGDMWDNYYFWSRR
uniref:Uncharacterized protein TCIL3000_11_15500 n=1 Tax=Trypanosoma congolense (strain IL3000) TaxID=1068625 RepID=G0V308_TRYCI|nr:unnamed protein product [Trypanosoma congolense IL3000]